MCGVPDCLRGCTSTNFCRKKIPTVSVSQEDPLLASQLHPPFHVCTAPIKAGYPEQQHSSLKGASSIDAGAVLLSGCEQHEKTITTTLECSYNSDPLQAFGNIPSAGRVGYTQYSLFLKSHALSTRTLGYCTGIVPNLPTFGVEY